MGMDHEKIIAAFGGTSEVARLCECTPQAVSQWFGVDPETGKPRTIPKSRLMFLKVIRPDLFNELAATAMEAAPVQPKADAAPKPLQPLDLSTTALPTAELDKAGLVDRREMDRREAVRRADDAAKEAEQKSLKAGKGLPAAE